MSLADELVVAEEVVWRRVDEAPQTLRGTLSVSGDRLRLRGSLAGTRLTMLASLPTATLARIRPSASADELVGGRPGVVLESDGAAIVVGDARGGIALQELARRLAEALEAPEALVARERVAAEPARYGG